MSDVDERVGVNSKEETASQIHYTTFIRLPFPRGDFVDPPLVDWDAAKDRALWKILSGKELAARFDVTLPFILQQAAWLYERQLSQVREQMSRANKPEHGDGAREPLSARPSLEDARTQRRGSAQYSVAPLANPVRPANPRIVEVEAGEGERDDRSKEETNAPNRQGALPPMSRTASSNTVTQSSQRPTSRGTLRAKSSFQRGTPPDREPAGPSARRLSQQTRERQRKPSSPSSKSSSSSSSSSSEAEEEKPGVQRSQYLRRPLKFTAGKPKSFRGTASRANLASEDDEDEEEPPFLPFSQSTAEATSDLGATVRGKDPSTGSQTDTSLDAPPRGITAIDSSASSAASSAAPVQTARDAPSSQRSAQSNPLSPRHKAKLAILNAAKKAKGGNGSEGTPSMGSSFSDLDDTSVTQSALEEALLSNVQKGVSTSRISNLSQALRSQYSRYQGTDGGSNNNKGCL